MSTECSDGDGRRSLACDTQYGTSIIVLHEGSRRSQKIWEFSPKMLTARAAVPEGPEA